MATAVKENNSPPLEALTEGVDSKGLFARTEITETEHPSYFNELADYFTRSFIRHRKVASKPQIGLYGASYEAMSLVGLRIALKLRLRGHSDVGVYIDSQEGYRVDLGWFLKKVRIL